MSDHTAIIAVVLLALIFAGLWVFNGRQKRKFEAEQRQRRRDLDKIKAEAKAKGQK